MADAIVAQARAEYPNEACGIIAGTADAAEGGAALRYEACRNEAASPYRYSIHPDDAFRVVVETDDADEAVWGIVHSHVRSPAVPSPTDVGLAHVPRRPVPPRVARRRRGGPVDRRAVAAGVADRRATPSFEVALEVG